MSLLRFVIRRRLFNCLLPGLAIFLLTPIAPDLLTVRTHETGETEERRLIKAAKTSASGAAKEITGTTGTDEAGLARGPTGTETARRTENVVTAVVTGVREERAATETATKKRDAERETKAKAKNPQN